MKNQNIKFSLIIACLLSFSLSLKAQITAQKIGANPTIKTVTALLELEATDKGFLMPRVALTDVTLSTPVSATTAGMANALIVYNTATAGTAPNDVTPGFYYWSASLVKWVRILEGNGADDTKDIWKDVPADATITAGPESAGGLARTETTLTVTGATQTNYTKASFLNTTMVPFNTATTFNVGRFGIGTVNPKGALHTYSPDGTYLDLIGNGVNLFLRKSITGSSAAVPGAVGAGTGLGQFVMTGYRGATGAGTWDESGGIAIQGISAENWSVSNNSSAAMRFNVTPVGASAANNQRKGALQIENDGRMILSSYFPATGTGSFSTGAGSYGAALTSRFTIQEKTADALTINAPLADFSSVSGTKVLIWESLGATPTVNDITAAGPNTYNTGKVGATTISSLRAEPWFVQGASPATQATDNTQNIYQMGKVAIGTSAPSGASAAAAQLYVAGDVEISGAYYTTVSKFADYVFEKYFKGKSIIKSDYEFNKLKYVKTFIEKFHHLPGVTPISEIEKKGNGYKIDLTEMSMQQLEKIEELFLHVIEQQVKIDEQELKIKALQDDSDKMKLRLEKLEKLLLKNNK